MTPTSTERDLGLRTRAALLVVLIAAVSAVPAADRAGQETAAASDGPLLRFLGIGASAESMDYVVNKSQFQLHTLPTEQRHPKTWSLSEKVQKDTEGGLRQLFSVDEDVAAKLDGIKVIEYERGEVRVRQTTEIPNGTLEVLRKMSVAPPPRLHAVAAAASA